MKTIAYEPVEGVNRVTIALGDDMVVVEGRTEVDEAHARALDRNPNLKRAAARKPTTAPVTTEGE